MTFARRLRSVDLTIWIALAAGIVAVCICAYELSLPHVLTGVHGVYGYADGYDDGVYAGVAIRLVHGSMPYRDFVFLQPPGIALVLSPIAALGRVIGTRDVLIIGRLLTVVVVGANAVIAGLVLRYRGWLAVTIAGFTLASFPLSLAASSSLMLEPYLVFFTLLGFALIFSKGDLSSRGRILWGGISLGFAGAVKIWAILPVLALLIVLAVAKRKEIRRAIAGIAIGFVVPTLPFALFAFHAFVHDVITTQFARSVSTVGGTGGSESTVAQRLTDITGTYALLNIRPYIGLAEVIAVVIAIAFFISTVVVHRRGIVSDRLIVIALGVVVIGMFLPHRFYDHYSYFPATFIALFAGFFLDEAHNALLSRARRFFGERRRWRCVVLTALPLIVFGAVCIDAIGQESSYASTYLADSFDYYGTIAIPAGSCVVTDFTSLTIDINRFVSSKSNCPDDIDALGNWLAEDNGAIPPVQPPFPASMVDHLTTELLNADYVVLSHPDSDYFPFTTLLQTWFLEHYQLQTSFTGMYVYRHVSDFASGS